MRHELKIFYVLGVCGLSFCLPRAWGCATELPLDEPAAKVAVTDETALLVWDEQKGIEHFIRRANFQTEGSKSGKFGFLVPTPSKPTLAPVADKIFEPLTQQLAPKIEFRTRKRWDFTPIVVSFFSGQASEDSATTNAVATSGSDSEGVDVLETRRVGDYKATILRADGPKALQNWLRANGYRADKDTVEWLAPYIANHWTITAFKVASNAPQSRLAHLNAVRLSFKTKRVFYPYREPARARIQKTPRSLRVFVLSKERMNGAIETVQGKQKWPGKLTYSAPLEVSSSQAIAQLAHLTASELKNTRLTAFDDFSSPRPGIGEVYFGHDSNQSPLIPPPIIHWRDETTHIPADVLVLVIGGLAFIFYWCWKVRPERIANSV